MTDKNGGSAFPDVRRLQWLQSASLDETQKTFIYNDSRGMTLRDYFAAKALEAILRQLDRGICPQDCIRAAEDAYFMADAMLKARQ